MYYIYKYKSVVEKIDCSEFDRMAEICVKLDKWNTYLKFICVIFH